ncbi:uncharacterized protein DS421_5g160300 [Arachis hypogaea]|nr:uncharacterized protein DS421_5g160300 [Arachis hypogaea]
MQSLDVLILLTNHVCASNPKALSPHCSPPSLFAFNFIPTFALSPNQLIKLSIPTICSIGVLLHPLSNSSRFWDLLPRPTISPPPFPFSSRCKPGESLTTSLL